MKNHDCDYKEIIIDTHRLVVIQNNAIVKLSSEQREIKDSIKKLVYFRLKIVTGTTVAAAIIGSTFAFIAQYKDFVKKVISYF